MQRTLFLLSLLFAASSDAYTAEDDVSWAVRSQTLAYPTFQERYDEFMEGCRRDAKERGKFDDCDYDEKYRLKMNTLQPRSVC